MNALDLLLVVLAGYLAIGALFAIPFAFVLAPRLDPVARSGSLPFKLLILPASALLWPALTIMSFRKQSENDA